MATKKRSLFSKNLGIVLSVVQFIVSAVFSWQLLTLNLLPDKDSIGICVIIFLLCVITLLLSLGRKAGITGKIISIILVIAMLCGSTVLGDISNTLFKMTANSNVQKEQVNVYILKPESENDLPTDREAANFTYGVMASASGESLDKMMEILAGKFGKKPSTAEYNTAQDLVDALYSGKIDAIIMSASYVPVIMEMEDGDYKNFYYTKDEEEANGVKSDTVILYSEEISIAREEVKTNLDSDILTMYLSGIDTFGDISLTSRSDVNIIAVINLKTKQILLINTPRDYFVNLVFANGKKSSTPDKLTHAGLYGIDVSMNTLESVYDIDFDYYFRVNFTGFMKIIDALGGIDVDVPKSFKGTVYGTWFEQGEMHLSGQEALDFVRERHAFIDGDNQRGRDQMQVITKLIKKASSPSVVSGYAQIIDSLQRYFQTDMPAEVISSLVKMQLDDGAEWNIVSTSVESEGIYAVPYSMSTEQWVMPRDKSGETRVNKLIQKVKDGETLVEDTNDYDTNDYDSDDYDSDDE